MPQNSIILKHLCFTGDSKSPAIITFEQGLNVLYGASETGKSFVLEAIDFMLGSNTPLRDIPERIGYDRIFLGIKTLQNEEFTLIRSTSGGNFQMVTGLHTVMPEGVELISLSAKHSSENDLNVSALLLSKINLQNKLLKRNAKGNLRNLSFRDLAHLCIIDEGIIQKKGSPIEATAQNTNKTAEYSLFKLLLTGVDDRSYVSTKTINSGNQDRDSKIEILDELLLNYTSKLPNETDSKEALNQQLVRLDRTILDGQTDLNISENLFSSLQLTRNTLRKRINEGVERRGEIEELRARFMLLDIHYNSDLNRLEGIREAGSLLTALEQTACPLCGSLPDHQHPDQDSEANIEMVIIASIAESDKIVRLQRELQETIQQLNQEASVFDSTIPSLEKDEHRIEQQIQKITSDLLQQRISYSDLIEKRSDIRSLVSILDQIEEINNLKRDLSVIIPDEIVPEAENTFPNIVELSSTVLDNFAQLLEKILKDWNFPDAERVQFEESTRDLIISGKRRGSRGKGMRSITHAAFIIGILEFCKNNQYPHPGFLVLDSPLLAYREPEDAEDDLSQTDVQDKFYEYLQRWSDRQIVIIENITPPQAITQLAQSYMFSKNPRQGRYGFFPLEKN